ncbi:uncharacterized protein [Centruroides vittatus]|uniref:uncharacterized protein n=1 Tax=Centruroides vittatus TaxID=120091 RepID=UPI003510190F
MSCHEQNQLHLVKLPPCFCELRNFLFNNIENPSKHHKDILELAHLISHTSFFGFEGKTYLQERGVPMGSPTSPLICELVLRKLENYILPFFQEDIVIYTRYVDDIFILWKNKQNINRFINLVNDNSYGLTLELEQESERQVNFLDLEIICREGHIVTKVYRKPIYQPYIIPRNSSDPEHLKLTAFKSWIKRAHTHCTSIYDTDRELDYIREIALQHGYRRQTIDTLIKTYQPHSRRIKKNEQKERIVLNYIPFLNKVTKKVARKRNFRIVYRRNPTVYKLLRNDKERYRYDTLTGVYSIPLRDKRFNSDLVYVGATMRNLKKRIEEHKYAVNKNVDSTVLAAFAKEQDVTVYWDKAEIIKPTRSTQAIKHIEKMEIHKAHLSKHCINHRDSDSLATAWKSFHITDMT